jgi:hypothetical protein
MNKTLHLLWVLLFFVSCKSENERRIVGKWQAAQLMECDNLVPIRTELVDIEFMSNGNYIFHSTLNIKEEGNYHIKKNFLFTQDKLRDKAAEKAVLIKSIDDDSLVLQMSYKGKDQWLTLIREGVSDKGREKEEADSKAKALAIAAGTATVDAASMPPSTPSDSAQNKEAAKKAEEEKKKQAEADKAAEAKKAEAAADKKREEEADRKREAAQKEEKNASSSEAYKKREAKRKAEERAAKEEADKKAEKFRKDYAKREAEKKKKK